MQGTAEEIPVSHLALAVRPPFQGVGPVFMDPAPADHPGRVRQPGPAEAVREDLIGDALAEPGWSGGLLIDR